MVIVWCFLAGLFMVYGLPYFIGGIRGKAHPTPFGSSSPQANVVWGWLALVLGAIWLHLSHNHLHPVRGSIFFAVGALIAAFVMADLWPKQATRRSRK